MNSKAITIPAAAALFAAFYLGFGSMPDLSGALRPGSGPDYVRVRSAAAAAGPAAEAADRIEARRLRAHINYLADPARQGRGLETDGLEETIEYVTARLKEYGLSTLGGSYFQTVLMRRVQPLDGQVVLGAPGAKLEFSGGRNAVLPQCEPGEISGEAVFAGYGIREKGYDDYRGLDVRGKVVVFLAGLPPGKDWEDAALRAKYAPADPADGYEERLKVLEELGARAAVAVEPGLAGRIAAGKEKPRVYYLAQPGAGVRAGLPLARVSAPAAAGPGVLESINSALLAVRGDVSLLVSRNVIGWLPGAGRDQGGEAVMLGAHMDHLGMPGGVVHPGADDNASGVAGLLEMIRAITAAPARPARPLIFAFWTGEEEGKFGSGHFTENPLWPLEDIAVYINLEMPGHKWTEKELSELAASSGLPEPGAFFGGLDPGNFTEPGVASYSRELGATLARAGRITGMSLKFDWTDGVSGGSDYRDFARKKVPFVRFFGNYYPEYHGPGDTPARIDSGQARRMARLALVSAWLFADQPARDRRQARR